GARTQGAPRAPRPRRPPPRAPPPHRPPPPPRPPPDHPTHGVSPPPPRRSDEIRAMITPVRPYSPNLSDTLSPYRRKSAAAASSRTSSRVRRIVVRLNWLVLLISWVIRPRSSGWERHRSTCRSRAWTKAPC